MPRSPNPTPRSALLLLALVSMGCNADPTKGQAKASSAPPVASSNAPLPAGVAFAIAPDNSQIEWTGSKVTGKHDGQFTSFTGAITLVGGSVEQSRVTVSIDTGSLTTVPDKLVHHLKSNDFFNVEQFPKASFASTSIKAAGPNGGYEITGNLVLHGITRSITFPATITVSNDTVTVDATFAINRKDFGINYPGKVDDAIRDDVLVKLAVHAPKQA